MSDNEPLAPKDENGGVEKRFLSALLWVVILALGGLIIYWAIWADSSPEWTGFGAYDEQVDGPRAKTLWDWMELLIVPVVLALGALWFNASQKKTELAIAGRERDTEREIAGDRQQQATLEAYYDRMADLLLTHDLRKTGEEDEERSIARARALTVLRSLDPQRKGQVVRFLHESRLINRENAVIYLSGANLSGANLTGTNLSGAYLRKADLRKADLSGADLREADLSGANLSGADLREADLSGAYLFGADLRYIKNWTPEQLPWAHSLENATMPDGSKYEEWIEKQGSQRAQTETESQASEEEE